MLFKFGFTRCLAETSIQRASMMTFVSSMASNSQQFVTTWTEDVTMAHMPHI